MVKYVQVLQHVRIGEPVPAETDELVEDAERVPQPAVGFLRDGVQGLGLGGDALLFGDAGQVLGDVRHGDPPEVEHLATGEDGGKDLVFLRGGQDEDGVGGRFLQGLQEGIEGR